MAQADLVAQIEEVQRELGLRYSRSVPATRKQTAALEDVLRTLVWLAANRAAVLAAKEKAPEGGSEGLGGATRP